MNVLNEILIIFDEIIFPHKILPFPSLSEMFSAEREVMLSVPSEEREITGVERVSVDVVSDVTLTDVNVSDPYRIVKSGHVRMEIEERENERYLIDRHADAPFTTNAPSPSNILSTLRLHPSVSFPSIVTLYPSPTSILLVSACVMSPNWLMLITGTSYSLAALMACVSVEQGADCLIHSFSSELDASSLTYNLTPKGSQLSCGMG